MNTPILFLVFNRPELTKQVFKTIRKAKPAYLFVAADGPRMDHSDENEICKQVREIATNVDWECEVKTLFRNENLGCGKAVSEAITWFFKHVEEGIILEDDCVCDDSFFEFASDLLEKYRTADGVMHIGAHGPLNKLKSDSDYSFIKYPLIWGWATWRRAWKHYDYNMKLWAVSGEEILKTHYPGEELNRNYWNKIFQDVFNKEIDTWDYQWAFACMENQGLSIFPHINLVKNIGFHINATHTLDCNHPRANMGTNNIKMPLSHPTEMMLNCFTNKIVEQDIFEVGNSGQKEKSKLVSYIKKIMRKGRTRLFVLNNANKDS